MPASTPSSGAETTASPRRNPLERTYRVGIVNLGLHGEEWATFFLEGPPGSLALLGAFTLEGFALAPDPVNKRLVPLVSLLA